MVLEVNVHPGSGGELVSSGQVLSAPLCVLLCPLQSIPGQTRVEHSPEVLRGGPPLRGPLDGVASWNTRV